MDKMDYIEQLTKENMYYLFSTIGGIVFISAYLLACIFMYNFLGYNLIKEHVYFFYLMIVLFISTMICGIMYEVKKHQINMLKLEK